MEEDGDIIISGDMSIEDIYCVLFKMTPDQVDEFEEATARSVEAIFRYRLMEESGEGH